jgi:hypothetical protein
MRHLDLYRPAGAVTTGNQAESHAIAPAGQPMAGNIVGMKKDIEAWRLVVADEAPISPGWSPGNRSGMQPGHCRIPITDRDGCGAGQ